MGVGRRDSASSSASQFLQKTTPRDFPVGAVVGNPPANAGDMGLSPGPGGSHMPRSSWAREPQLLSLRVWSLCATTAEPVLWSPRGTTTEARMPGARAPQQ